MFVGLAFFVGNFVPDVESPFGSHADYYALAGVPTFIFVALAAPDMTTTRPNAAAAATHRMFNAIIMTPPLERAPTTVRIRLA